KKVLIDSVPWRTLPEGEQAAPAQETAPEDEPPPPPPLPPTDAAAPPSTAEPVPVAADGPTGPDNWGLTGPSPMAPSGEEPAPEAAPESAQVSPQAPATAPLPA